MRFDLARIEYGDTPERGRMAVVTFKVEDPPVQDFTLDVLVEGYDDPNECVRAAKLKVQALALHLAEASAA